MIIPPETQTLLGRLPAKFGPYGGQFVPETLIPALLELEDHYMAMRSN